MLMKNVLLVGIEGVYNYGCEAIVRGTVKILKDIDSGINVSYASYNYVDDVARLAGCDVNIIERRHFKRWGLRNILRKLLSYMNIKLEMPYDDISLFDGFDAVFSIGGDIYTLTSDGGYNKELPLLLEKCRKVGAKYILWGASVGKFEKNPQALSFYKEHLRKIDAIVVRENVSYEYLKSLGLDNTLYMAPDPAFSVPCENLPSGYGPEPLVGINLSPHSAIYMYGSTEEAKQRQCDAIVRLVETMQCHIMLLPHVISADANDNDLSYMREIRDKIPEVYRDKVELLDADYGFVGLKEYIAKCDFVIAARMHCAINAICVGIPTLFLSYSEKAKGMSEFVYGNKQGVLSLNEFEDTEIVVARLRMLYGKHIDLPQVRSFDYKKLLSRLL